MSRSIYWDWHAGEPLVTGYDFYLESTKEISKHKPKNLDVNIGLQTNATLITDELAKLFKKHHFRIGVSLDGPEAMHDHNRVYRNGKGSFNEAIQGISLLKKHKVPFHIICVLSFHSLAYPEELYQFFKGLKIDGVAFNIEEVEGIHASSSLQNNQTPDAFSSFFNTFFKLHVKNGQPFQIREWNRFVNYKVKHLVNGTTVPFDHLTIDVDGNFATFSPELATIENNPRYPSFILGNIKTHLIIDTLNNPNFKKINNDIQKGVQACKSTCSYFDICGGGMASNKLFENGTFNSTTTMACTLTVKRMSELARQLSLNAFSL